jgi:methanogenic corrinoid protein MtbC1
METHTGLKALGADGLLQFQALQTDAVNAVSERFYEAHGASYARFGPRGREACREDLAFHLEFLRPVLEFGVLQPMVDYLAWLGSVLSARAIPLEHLALSLDWLGQFFAERMPAADGAVVADVLKAAETKFLAAGNRLASPAPPSTQPWPELEGFEAALLAGRQHEASTIVNRCLDEGHSLVDLELHLILPSLYEIGEKWQANKVTVAQEHMATAIVQSVMTAGLLRSLPPPLIAKRVLLACVEGNSHAIGLRMVSDGFQLAGWDVQFLGANMPTMALVGQVVAWLPDLVGLSVSFPQQLRVVKDIMARLDKLLGPARPAVIIGGLAINSFSQLAGAVGADAHRPNAPSAVAYANKTLAA